MNGTMHKWLLKSLGSLSLASTVVLLPLLLTGCGESSTGTVTPVPPPPPPPPPAPPAPPPPPPTPAPAPTPTTAPPISALPTQLAALTPGGQVFSNPTVIPVGFGIRRSGAGENLPVGTYSDFRAVLSFPIPDAIPRNAIVQGAQLTLVQLPSSDSATIPGFGDRGRGFFFLDATPHNVAANSVVFQEVRLGAVDNVVSSDFFAPATSGFVALSFTGNVLGGDASAGPRTADVGPGVQRAVSAPGPRFYQVRLQCAKEVWNNQATAVFPTLTASSITTTSASASGAPAFNAVAPVEVRFTGTVTVGPTASASTYLVASTNPATLTITLLATNPVTVSFSAAGSTFTAFLPTGQTTITQSILQIGSLVGGSFTFAGPTVSNPATVSASFSASGSQLTGPVNLTLFIPNQTFSYTATFTASFTSSGTVAGTPANAAGFEISQGATGTCRAEFDKEPATGTGAGPITTARGPRLDITFTVPR
ncbi:hypothetical protein [Synechococcus sp. R60.3]|uniref:hypothetical protein n=1 Tax=Synechococcus sp. R60.3 TaxID=2967123 RepID=UPI0039C28217